MTNDLDPETLAIHTGVHRSQFNEHSESLYLTSSFVFDSAAQAAARFSGQEPGNIYSRFTNPTVTAMQERLAVLEGAEACIATASGMSAILTCVMGLLSAGDHIVASRSLFGSTVSLFNNILSRFGIQTTFVSATDPAEWQAAVRPNTRLFFLETPSNPLTEISDIAALAEIAKRAGVWLAVDNCFCTPIIQQPLKLGADLVIHSATKYLDGQGRVLGGAILGKRDLLMDSGIFSFLRTAGPSLSAFNAWIILKGMETLSLRVKAHSDHALEVARWLETHPRVGRVFYPGLPSHPQHELAMRQQKTGGGIVSFEVKGGREAAWRVVDAARLMSITANLGDTKSTLTHPATTTHGRISQEAREAAGIRDGLLRIAVGLESPDDLKADLARGLQ
ncbi:MULTISPECIES: O-succinylhomoserine sulfhydrylase [Nitrosomonas]|uniref:O-succinylhomoserine sulfhydrylase n=1 Tax=Nitrosomonas europaea (strain ATCC 19718 / CIP 103999 / KCTC 2705 / NBRC 14298) TaxID=228410 RepID=Q82WH6_NITEU|nr:MULTISPECIES: O-succinylhomoserine sulfhydrylase [Nitrosomonas]CAD84611.1 Cys/Met metabolism pyridoxal-phosphate-dependent enzymes [Nitrosomonas europaea ATCC 19718]SDW07131.1 O-succinylhomoserine sulfhydrylase [Nitrosomonas europaea]SES70510.1 O-succinylhomoserine sulfhydrylase [Nitrosomonas europaea]SJZ30404.1 O-succinylhomoserine sulfhydrylase [Nitrosomonas europaea]HBF24365.1 O-succinylhomoserine sulfhydrylase [Nitrosomonas sp.]